MGRAERFNFTQVGTFLSLPLASKSPLLVHSLTAIMIMLTVRVHCRNLRQQVEIRGLSYVDLGPDEWKLRLKSEPEMLSSQQQEIEKLRDDLTKKQTELNALKRQVINQW